MFKFANRFSNLGEEFYSKVLPSPLTNPHLIHFNEELSAQLNLNDDKKIDWAAIIGGKTVLKNYTPSASLYAGHQFGVWVPQLGDGRAMLIAEHEDSLKNIWEFQTKGGGSTPYSRNADGRAVLRSSIREYLCSHANHKLGIPTTLALALVGSESRVYREKIETAAVVLRIAPSFIRFGSFEVFSSRNHDDNLNQLIQFVLNNYYPECIGNANPTVSMYKEVIRRTALMVAKWQAFGFCHGVMNTDNMSILGLTLDYGPFGFLDRFDPKHICNHSDYNGRYSYENQPYIAWWNLARLGESLLNVVPENEIKDALATFTEVFTQYYLQEFGNKLGISDLSKADLGLLEELLRVLASRNVDWTIFWRQLCYFDSDKVFAILPESLLQNEDYITWLRRYRIRIKDIDPVKKQLLMLNSNPAIIPRNYMLQLAIEKAESGDFIEVERLFKALANPYVESSEYADYQGYPPDSAKDLVLSCSS